MTFSKCYLFGTAAVCALIAGASAATAGGLALREQSTSSQGASFAGSAAGGDLSSSFWNSAAIGIAPRGLSSESHGSLIVPKADVTSNSITVLPGSAAPAGTTVTGDSITMDRPAVLTSSYYAYRWNDNLVLGMAVNSPFGLANETSNDRWSGQYHFRSAKLLTVNLNPMASYKLANGLYIGAGVQVQYASLKFKSNPSSALSPTQGNSVLDGDDVGVGFTAGILWQPSQSTAIGLGYRSRVDHTVRGDASMASGFQTTGIGFGDVPFAGIQFDAKLSTPDIATLSFRQAIAPNVRLLGTVEWTNWSLLDKVDFIATEPGGLKALGAAGTAQVGQLLNRFDFHWKDGWFFALGGEYDWSKQLTLRTGAAYEISPIQSADSRKANITDSNRTWLSLGATYKWTQSTSFDLAYSHVIFDNANIDQLTTTPGSATTPVRRLLGSVEQQADIISLSMKTRW